MQEKVIAVNKNGEGNIVSVKTDAGQVYRLDQAIEQVHDGRLTGLQVINRSGQEYLRTYADDVPENNLDNLPEF